MAFATTGRFFASVVFLDAGNNQSTMDIEVRAANITAAEGVMAAQIADLVAVTEAYIVSYAVREQFVNDAVRVPAGEVEEKAVITLNLATAPKKGVVVIPAPAPGIFAGAPGTNAYNDVDPNDAAVIALVADYVTTAGVFYLSDGESAADANTFIKGRRTHRSSSRG